MKLSSINLVDRFLKITLGANVLFWGVSFDNLAAASTFTSSNYNYNYKPGEYSYFSLKLTRNNYNQLANNILQQKSNFSEYINSIINEKKSNKYISAAELNIVFKSQLTKEKRLLDYLFGSLQKLEFKTFTNNSFAPSVIPVLPQVAYGNIYQDVYDFEISLVDTPPIQSRNSKISQKKNPTTNQPRKTKYFASYFQESKRPNYSSLTNSNLGSITNQISPLLTSSQATSSLDNLLNSKLTGFPLLSNQSQLNSLLETSVSSVAENNLGSNSGNSQGNNQVETVDIYPTDIEVYRLDNVPSNLTSYQKPDHQEQLEKILEKQERKVEQQRERMYKKIAKLRQQREKAREKEFKRYQRIREQQLNQARNQHQQIQEQLLQQ